MDLKTYSFSLTGKYHAEHGMTNQDRVETAQKDDLSVVVLCDGAGGLKYGETAAQLVSQTVCEFLLNHFEELYYSEVFMIRKRISSIIRKQLNDYAISQAIQYKELGCTLLAVAVMGNKIITLHLGDGHIAFKRRGYSFEAVSNPQNGWGSSTYLTSMSDFYPYLRCYRWWDTEVEMILMATDGISDFKTIKAFLDSTNPEEAFLQIEDHLRKSSLLDDSSIACIYTNGC